MSVSPIVRRWDEIRFFLHGELNDVKFLLVRI